MTDLDPQKLLYTHTQFKDTITSTGFVHGDTAEGVTVFVSDKNDKNVLMTQDHPRGELFDTKALENGSIYCFTPQGREVSLKCAIQTDICCGLMIFVAGIEADASIQYNAIQAHTDFIHNMDNYHQHALNSALAASFHLGLDTETREKMLKQSDIMSITTQNSWESHSASVTNIDHRLAYNEQQCTSKRTERAKFGPQNVLNVLSNASLSTTAVEAANKLVTAGTIDRANKKQTENYSEIDKFVGKVRAEFATPEKVGENSAIAIGIASKNEKERFSAFAQRCISEGKIPAIDPFWAKDETSTVDADVNDPGFCGHAVFHITQGQCKNVCTKLGYLAPSTGAGTGNKPQKFSGYTLYKKMNPKKK